MISEMARVCAHLVDAVKDMTAPGDPTDPQAPLCPSVQCVVAMVRPSPAAARVDVIQRWFPTLLQVEGKVVINERLLCFSRGGKMVVNSASGGGGGG